MENVVNDTTRCEVVPSRILDRLLFCELMYGIGNCWTEEMICFRNLGSRTFSS